MSTSYLVAHLKRVQSGCKKIINSADMVETVISDYMSPHCNPELEESKLIFLHHTLAHDDNEDREPIFLQDTLAYDAAYAYQV